VSLLLNVLRCPEGVVPETRSVNDGEVTIGRGDESDWVLDDPERHLSKRHCVVVHRSGGWWVQDVSTNGTFVNGESAPLGPQAVRGLKTGDRLYLGPYEIEVSIEDEASGRPEESAIAQCPRKDSSSDDDPFAGWGLPEAPSHDEPGPVASLGSGARLPENFDPLRLDIDELSSRGPTHPDHSPAVQDAFRAPRAVAELLPEDWDDEPGRAATAQPEQPALLPPDQVIAPAAPPSEPPAVTAQAAYDPEPGGELAAFLRGAGLPQALPADPIAAMEQLGRAFREVVSGLRSTMMARAAVKSEFRISQTAIRPHGNNPLKFSIDDNDALAALLGVGRRVEMLPEAAVAEALRDIRLHELASAAAMQAAARALLAQLDPDPIRHEAERAGMNLVPAAAKGRAWDAFESLYAKTTKALADDFDSVFGRAFARAYEQTWQEITVPEQN
jgi:type VI secretion system FHA domain protein